MEYKRAVPRPRRQFCDCVNGPVRAIQIELHIRIACSQKWEFHVLARQMVPVKALWLLVMRYLKEFVLVVSHS